MFTINPKTRLHLISMEFMYTFGCITYMLYFYFHDFNQCDSDTYSRELYLLKYFFFVFVIWKSNAVVCKSKSLLKKCCIFANFPRFILFYIFALFNCSHPRRFLCIYNVFDDGDDRRIIAIISFTTKSHFLWNMLFVEKMGVNRLRKH